MFIATKEWIHLMPKSLKSRKKLKKKLINNIAI